MVGMSHAPNRHGRHRISKLRLLCHVSGLKSSDLVVLVIHSGKEVDSPLNRKSKFLFQIIRIPIQINSDEQLVLFEKRRAEGAGQW